MTPSERAAGVGRLTPIDFANENTPVRFLPETAFIYASAHSL